MCLGVPGIVQSVESEWSATVNVSGVTRNINIAYLSDLEKANIQGQWVLVHVGFAMAVIDEKDAKATLELLSQLSE